MPAAPGEKPADLTLDSGNSGLGRFTSRIVEPVGESGRPGFGLQRVLSDGLRKEGSTSENPRVRPDPQAAESAEGSVAWAERSFSYLKDDADAGDPASSGVASGLESQGGNELSRARTSGQSTGKPQPPQPFTRLKAQWREPQGRKALLREARRLAVVVASIAVVGGVFTALAFVPAFAPPLLTWLGKGAGVVANTLAFYYAIPQVLRTFREGNATATPVKRALLGAGASLALWHWLRRRRS